MAQLSREKLENSLNRQRRLLSESLILNPVENIPIYRDIEIETSFLEGLYVTDKIRGQHSLQSSKIVFGGRDVATEDTIAIYDNWVQAFGGKAGSMRLLSGLHAHTSVFMSIGKIGDKILILPETAGGHFSTPAILSRLGYKVLEAKVDYNNFCLDLFETKKLIKAEKPKFLFIDRSEGLWFEDFAPLLEDFSGYTVFDISHYVPQILFKKYLNPFDIGTDLLLFSLHKSFPGPQKAMVIAKEKDQIWSKLISGLGQYVSSLHISNVYLAGLALSEKTKLSIYTDLMLKNTIALEEALLKKKLPVFKRSNFNKHCPITHHIWMPINNSKKAYSFFRRLETFSINVNYRLLPYQLGYGLRVGT